MKNNLLTILALGGLLFASSCQMDEPDSGTLTGEVDFSITAGIPSGITTYTPAGSGSHNGGAMLLDPEKYTLRYTLEVYDKDDKLAYEATKEAEEFEGVTFDVRLLAKVYDFVFWADFVNEDGTAFYNVDDLKNITYAASTVSAQELANDAADAYYKKEEVNLTQSSKSLDVTLQRPFGKIRLIATDVLDGNNTQTEIPKTVTIDFGNALIPTAFNAYEGKVIEGSTADAGVVNFLANKETTMVNNQEKKDVYLLGINYIFESSAIPSYSMDVTVTSDQGNIIGQRSLSSIPVQENKLTTVIGNFYTNEGNIDVIVEDKFDGENVEEVEDLVFPEEGKVLLTKEDGSQETFNTIEEAFTAAGSDKAIITLDAYDYDVTAVVPANCDLRIVGQEGTTINAVTAGQGIAQFENIKFDGFQTHNEKATVYAYNDAKIYLVNCYIEAPENTRPISSQPGFSGTFSLDGCTIDKNKGDYLYLNGAANDGCIILKNNTFVGGGGTIGIMNSLDGEKAYPIVEGNDFGGYNPSFDYWSDPVITNQSQLDPDTKEYVSDFLSNNTVPNGVKVAPYGGNSFIVNSLPLNITNETTGKRYETIREAIAYAEDGQTLSLKEGSYDLGAPGQIDQPGHNGYYLKIDKGLTLKGEGEVSIHTSHDANTGAWSLQNLVTVTAADVTLDGITFIANYNSYYSGPNKTIEVLSNANNFTIKNCKIIEGKTENDAGCLYIGGDDGQLTANVINCTFEHAAITVRPGTSATIEGCSFDGIRLTEGWNTSLGVRGNAIVSECEFKNCDGEHMANVVIAQGNGFINLVGNNFPSDGTYWTSFDNGVILFDGKYPFSGGEGTFEDPYQLSTPEDILMIGRLSQNKNSRPIIYSAALELTQDIDISGTPIKNLGVMGCLLDGNGHTLKVNLTSEGSLGTGNNVGLFAGFNGKGNEYIYEATTPAEIAEAYEINGKKYVIKGGCIRDLVIEGSVYSNADGAVSPLGCGQNTGYIINVKNYADITAEGSAYFVAGIISGTRGTGLVLDCENYGDITVNTSSSVIGGITSQLYGGSACNGTYPDILAPYSASVKNCKNYGTITASGSRDVGGIVGQTHGYGDYEKCISDCANSGNISGATNVGGIIGRHTYTGGELLLSGNTNSGTISATDGTNGPIFGKNEGTLIDGSQNNN